MDPNSEEIKQENSIDKYLSRPNILKDMCLADFVALTETTYKYNKEILSDDNMSIDEDSSDEETHLQHILQTLTPLTSNKYSQLN